MAMERWRSGRGLKVKLEGKTAIVTGSRRGIGRAVFLASEEADYISGAAIVIDGGWLTS